LSLIFIPLELYLLAEKFITLFIVNVFSKNTSNELIKLLILKDTIPFKLLRVYVSLIKSYPLNISISVLSIDNKLSNTTGIPVFILSNAVDSIYISNGLVE